MEGTIRWTNGNTKSLEGFTFQASCSVAAVTPRLAHQNKDRPRARPVRVRSKEAGYFFLATFLAGAFFLAAFFLAAFLAGAFFAGAAFLAAAFFFAAMVLVFVGFV